MTIFLPCLVNSEWQVSRVGGRLAKLQIIRIYGTSDSIMPQGWEIIREHIYIYIYI